MSKALVIEVRDRGGRFETAERNVPEPAAGEIRIKVEACGICRGDELCRTACAGQGRGGCVAVVGAA